MSPGAERDHRGQPPEGDHYVRQQLASIDGSLFSGMPVDDRYESGVPEGQRGNSLDFIQMTGLTRPPLRQAIHGIEGALAQIPIYDDLNATSPVSFYEKGVADVDETLGDESVSAGLRDATLDTDLVPNRHSEPLAIESGSSRSAQAFRDIVAGLQRGEVAPAPEQAPTADDFDAEVEDTAPEEEEAYTGSASGALLALVEELESVMGIDPPQREEPETTEESSQQEAIEIADVEVAQVELEPEHLTAEDAPALVAPIPGLSSTPAADINDDDFDALLSALARGEAPPADEAPAEELSTVEIAPEEVEREPDGVVEVIAPDSMTDEWDALLDSMTVRGAETPMAPSVKSPGSDALAEAEQLMQALEKRPKSTPVSPPVAPPTPTPLAAEAPIYTAPAPTETTLDRDPLRFAPAPATQPVVADDLERGAPYSTPLVAALAPALADGEVMPSYDYTAAPSRRRSRRHSRVARRGLKIIKGVFYLALLGALGATVWIYVVGPMLLKDDDLSARAELLMAEEDYDAASQVYQQLATRIPAGDVERANAEFRAAYALTLGPATSWDEFSPRYERSLALFQQFIQDYPQHPKRARALSIMGRLHYELKDFEQAITVFRDQVKPADDPAAALSMLRYLARAYSMTGNYDQAETSYLQAATLPGNYSAEADYLELGDLFRRRAENTNVPTERDALKEMAMSYWRRAMQVPGIAPGVRSNLEERLQWLSFTEQAEGSAATGATPEAPVIEVPAPAAPAIETAAPDEVVPAESSIPVPVDEAGRAETPGAELEALVPSATEAPVAPAPAHESQ